MTRTSARAWMLGVLCFGWARRSTPTTGDLVAPPRSSAELGGGRLVLTAGRLRGQRIGYRLFDTLGTETDTQLTVGQDETTGLVRPMAVGTELGPHRVGAIGAVAADVLAPPEVSAVAVIGAGR